MEIDFQNTTRISECCLSKKLFFNLLYLESVFFLNFGKHIILKCSVKKEMCYDCCITFYNMSVDVKMRLDDFGDDNKLNSCKFRGSTIRKRKKFHL